MPATVMTARHCWPPPKAEAAEKVRELKAGASTPAWRSFWWARTPPARSTSAARSTTVRSAASRAAASTCRRHHAGRPAGRGERLADDSAVHGILVQLPLPTRSTRRLSSTPSPPKDVDGFSPVTVGRMQIGEPCYLPCTPAGCIRMIESTGTDIAGKNAVVIGRSNIVGQARGAAAAGEECHGHDLPFQDEEPGKKSAPPRIFSWPPWAARDL